MHGLHALHGLHSETFARLVTAVVGKLSESQGCWAWQWCMWPLWAVSLSMSPRMSSQSSGSCTIAGTEADRLPAQFYSTQC